METTLKPLFENGLLFVYIELFYFYFIIKCEHPVEYNETP